MSDETQRRAEYADKFDEFMKSFICTDGGCIFGHPGGMHTNGGCQSIKLNPVETKRLLMTIVYKWRELS